MKNRLQALIQKLLVAIFIISIPRLDHPV
jgi:hypothetical protein